VEAWAISRGVSQVQLSVNVANHAAIAVYERWGFQPQMNRMTKRISGG
jgi:RimJ/RimL family protein N-acetyltransferase